MSEHETLEDGDNPFDTERTEWVTPEAWEAGAGKAEAEEDLTPEEREKRARASKKLANLRHRMRHPEKHGRDAWSEAELEEMRGREAELEAERGPVKEQTPPGQGKPRQGPADRLAERRKYMSRHVERDQDGKPLPPTIKQLMAHADKFGPDAVVQTAIEMGYGVDSCVRLMDHCDRAEAARHRKERPKAPPLRFGDSEKRVAAMMGEAA